MAIAEVILSEFEEEIAATRRVLERVPDDRLSFKPHDRSMTLGELATHIAELPGWAHPALNENEGDYASEQAGEREQLVLESVGEILDVFDRESARARDIVASTSDEDFLKLWSPTGRAGTLLSGPKAAVFQRMVLNHLVHHRGQLTVFLRLLEVPLPQLYGPTADESKL